MLNTPSAWEAMPDIDVYERVARLRRSAITLRNVYGAFAPWQHLSTGILELDTLLSAAGAGNSSSCGSCGGAGGREHEKKTAVMKDSRNTNDISDDRGVRGNRYGGGGLRVGGLHEFYGPPLAGKTYLLRCIAATYTGQMTAFRQLYLDELERDQTCPTAPVFGNETWLSGFSEKESDPQSDSMVQPMHSKSAPSTPVPAPSAALCDWDLYVCVVRGASSLLSDDRSSASSLSADVLSWQNLVMEVFPSPASSSLFHLNNGERRNSRDEHAAGSEPPSRRQLQRDYAADHCHICEVSTPNELLEFLGGLLSSDSTGGSFDVCPSGATSPLRQQQQQKLSISAAVSFFHRAETTKVEHLKRKRSLSDSSDDHEGTSAAPQLPSAVPSFTSVASKHTWDLQWQRLLLIDGLDQLWLHPSFGTHSGTHTGQWFSMELHRLLRCFVTPQPSQNISASGRHAGEAFSEPISMYSTVVVTNGCHSGSCNLYTSEQLQDRLCSSFSSDTTTTTTTTAAQGRKGGRPGLRAALPRPAGNPVWLMAADTRCLVEPAHPGLVSFPLRSTAMAVSSLRGSTRGDTNKEGQECPYTSFSTWASRGPLSGSSRTVFSSSFANSEHMCNAFAEAQVTVVQGGSHVGSTWVERRKDEENWQSANCVSI